jgi:hypothetical protein
MYAIAEIAGCAAAHAVWSVSDGSTLIPMLWYKTEDDQRQMVRLAHDRLEAAVLAGRHLAK